MDSHPYNPPMVYVKPTSTMQIKEGRNVDRNGKIDLPYLREWKYVSVLCLKCFIWSFFNTLFALKDYKRFTLNTCWYTANHQFFARLFCDFSIVITFPEHYICGGEHNLFRDTKSLFYLCLQCLKLHRLLLCVFCCALIFVWAESTYE